MKVLVSPDKFKGTLTATAAGEAMAAGVRAVYADAELTILPIADGGEGTLEAVLAAGATVHTTSVQGPLGQSLEAQWAMLGNTAVIETARASGLEHQSPSEHTAAAASSYGSGQLISAALDAGAHEIILGVGGSAMTDGGSGALRALGARVLDANNTEIPLGGSSLAAAAALDASCLDQRLTRVRLRIAVDVQSPLYGPRGAAHIFGAQKGADEALRAALDAALSNWAAVLREASGVDVQQPGAGAAGGFPAAFLAIGNAQLEPGFALVAALTGLDAELADADLVITGEGSLDEQSEFGKAPLSLADQAQAKGIPVLAIAGRITLTKEQLAEHGVVVSRSLAEIAPSERESFDHAALWTQRATEAAVREYARRLVS